MVFFQILIYSLLIFTISDFIPRLRKITLLLSFILCVTVAGFRNMGGVDFIYYKNHYYGYDPVSYEKGYEFIVKLCNILGFTYEQYIFILAFISFLLLFICVKRYSPMPQFTILLYVGSFFIFYNIIALRQSISIIIFILSLQYLNNKEYKKYSICLLLAFLFHKSAIVLFAGTFFIGWFKLNIIQASILGAITLFIHSFNLFDFIKIFPSIGLSFVSDKMQYYTDDDRTFTLTTIIKLSILFFLILLSYKKLLQRPYFRIFANMTLLYIALFIMFSKWGVLTRMWVYFEIGYIFLIPIILQYQKRYIQIPIYYSFAIMAIYSILNMIQTFDNGDLLLFKLNFL